MKFLIDPGGVLRYLGPQVLVAGTLNAIRIEVDFMEEEDYYRMKGYSYDPAWSESEERSQAWWKSAKKFAVLQRWIDLRTPEEWEIKVDFDEETAISEEGLGTLYPGDWTIYFVIEGRHPKGDHLVRMRTTRARFRVYDTPDCDCLGDVVRTPPTSMDMDWPKFWEERK